MRRAHGAVLAMLSLFATSESPAVEFVSVTSDPVHCAGIGACNADALCPSGLFAYGGGIIGDQVKAESSRPISSGDSRGWRVEFRGAFFQYGTAAHSVARARVVCGPNPGGYTFVVGPFTSCPDGGDSCVTGATCPAGWTLLSGGIDADESHLQFSGGQGDGTWVTEWYPDAWDFGQSVSSQARAYAVCGNDEPDGFAYASGAGSECTSGPCTDVAHCAAGTVAIGGGFYGVESKIESMAPVSATAWMVSWYPAAEELGDAARGYGRAIASCAAGNLPDPIFAAGFE